jgi:hypothetical protein
MPVCSLPSWRTARKSVFEESGMDAGLFSAVMEDGKEKSFLRSPAWMPVCSLPSWRTARKKGTRV